jgi:hypothetical protein
MIVPYGRLYHAQEAYTFSRKCPHPFAPLLGNLNTHMTSRKEITSPHLYHSKVTTHSAGNHAFKKHEYALP